MIRYAVLLAAALLICAGTAAGRQEATVRVDDLRVRSGPGTDYRVLGSLAKDEKVVIVDRQKGWLKITHKKGTGFILDRDKFIHVDAPAPATARQGVAELKNTAPSAESIDSRLKQSQAQLARITRKEKAVLEEFDAAEEALSRTRRQVRAAEAELDELERQIRENQQRSTRLESDIDVSEAYAASRLSALYKLNWAGRLQLLATADSFFDFINRKSALEKILSQDEALLDALNEKKTALELLLTQLNAGKAEKRSLEISLKQRVRQLSGQQKKRKTLLAKIRGAKSLELAALESLKQAALKLDATLQQIEPAPPAPPPSAARPGNKPFMDYKGLLRWPVKGKIISFFGPYKDKKYAVTNFQSGINIQAERGEPIRAVSDGYTIYASWFKGFGNMMIIDHGDHYYTVYAHLEEVFKVKGDRVEKDEVIATVGDSGSMMGPALHFEVRHHGKPQDPLKWIGKS